MPEKQKKICSKQRKRYNMTMSVGQFHKSGSRKIHRSKDYALIPWTNLVRNENVLSKTD